MTDTASLTRMAAEYGFPFVLCIALLIYVYKNQEKLDKKSDTREQKADQREMDYKKYIEALKDDLCKTARDNNQIIIEINQDVDTLHQKLTGLGGEVDAIKADVRTIKQDVLEIKTDVRHIDNAMGGRK